MTDLVPYQAQSLVSWAQEADAAYVLAERMVATSFCPTTFKGKPAEAAAAVLAGAEVGLSPLAALRSFDIIQGVAAPRALTLRAIAQAAGCHFQTVEESERKVVMRAKRPGGEWETVTWTIERAQRLKLTGKDNWAKQPQAMLVARATAELARRVAADRILGLGYAAEEVDGEDEPAGRRTVARKPRQAPAEPDVPSAWDQPQKALPQRSLRKVSDVDLPPLPGEVVTEEPPAPQPAASEAPEAEPLYPVREQDGGGVTPTGDRPGFITRAQLKMLHVLLNKIGLGDDRDGALAYYVQHGGTGRAVESSKDLSRVEAGRIIDQLLAETTDPEPGFDEPYLADPDGAE